MRTLRGSAAAIVVVTVLAVPTTAAADGGAYIELDRTHYLPGSAATAEAYVSVPAQKQFLFDRGPFFVYVVPGRASIIEGRAIPAEAVKVGMMTIERRGRGQFELRSSFTVPDLPGDYYSVAICNDPCTISGFRESLTGSMSIVQTLREGTLLTKISNLESTTWTLKRRLNKAERQSAELETQLADGRDQSLELYAEVSRLERELAAAQGTVGANDDRPLVNAWTVVVIAAIVVMFGIGLGVVVRRRRQPLLVPDTIEELVSIE